MNFINPPISVNPFIYESIINVKPKTLIFFQDNFLHTENNYTTVYNYESAYGNQLFPDGNPYQTFKLYFSSGNIINLYNKIIDYFNKNKIDIPNEQSLIDFINKSFDINKNNNFLEAGVHWGNSNEFGYDLGDVGITPLNPNNIKAKLTEINFIINKIKQIQNSSFGRINITKNFNLEIYQLIPNEFKIIFKLNGNKIHEINDINIRILYYHLIMNLLFTKIF